VGTANVYSRAPACPLLLWRCVRGGPLPYTAGAPDQGADRIGFLIWRSGDHFPNTWTRPTRWSSGFTHGSRRRHQLPPPPRRRGHRRIRIWRQRLLSDDAGQKQRRRWRQRGRRSSTRVWSCSSGSSWRSSSCSASTPPSTPSTRSAAALEHD
jgi:hypothetical protein